MQKLNKLKKKIKNLKQNLNLSYNFINSGHNLNFKNIPTILVLAFSENLLNGYYLKPLEI